MRPKGTLWSFQRGAHHTDMGHSHAGCVQTQEAAAKEAGVTSRPQEGLYTSLRGGSSAGAGPSPQDQAAVTDAPEQTPRSWLPAGCRWGFGGRSPTARRPSDLFSGPTQLQGRGSKYTPSACRRQIKVLAAEKGGAEGQRSLTTNLGAAPRPGHL